MSRIILIMIANGRQLRFYMVSRARGRILLMLPPQFVLIIRDLFYFFPIIIETVLQRWKSPLIVADASYCAQLGSPFIPFPIDSERKAEGLLCCASVLCTF